MGGLPELSLKEKVLLWLVAVEEGEQEGLASTQAGISASTGLSRGHASRTLAPLVKKGILREEKVRATGFSRVLKAYRVTAEGHSEYQRLRSLLLKAPVAVTAGADSDGTTRPLGDLLPAKADAGVLWRALDQLWTHGTLDPDPDALLVGPARQRSRYEMDLSQSPPRASVFVGRTQELDTLRDWLTGDSGVFMVEAPGGTGKSSLLLELLGNHRPNRHVFWVRLTPWVTQERFVHMLDDFVRRLGRAVVSPRSLEPEALPDHFLRSMKGLPVLLVLDDVQKADSVLLRTILHLVQVAHRLPTLKVLLAGRMVELADQRLPPEQRMRLQPLGPPDARHLLTQRGVSKAAQETILQAAGGVPLFLELLAQREALDQDRSVTHDQLITDLGAGLSDVHQELLSVASALRVPFSAAFLDRLRIGSRSTLWDLVNAGLLRHRADDLFEMHDLVSTAFYDRIPYSRRKKIHALLAEAYRPARRGRMAQAEDELGAITEYLHHLVASDRRDEAVRWVLRNQSRIMEQAERFFRDEKPPVAAPPAH